MPTYKIVLIGDSSVGKTSLVTKFAYKRFVDHSSSTIGASFTSYDMNNDDERVRLNIWDTAGQERYRSMVTIYYRDVHFGILVFDISNYKIKDIKYWINEYLYKTNSKNSRFLLVGNKCDLLEDDQNQHEDLEKLAKKYCTKIFKTSSKSGYNVEKIFEYMGKELVNMPLHEKLNLGEKYLTINEENTWSLTNAKLSDVKLNNCCNI